MQQISTQSQQLKGFKFIDLFAGIGGFHYALKSFGAECVFASEIDEKAAATYFKNHFFKPKGDITKIAAHDIPKHDILCAGFPCQAFSISGKQKGFEDTRGTLFFEIARIIDFHQPKIVLLENVKNFVRHNKGKTLQTVLNTLKNLGYTTHYKVLNTGHFGLPQNRERVYIIAFHHGYKINNFDFPALNLVSSLSQILEKQAIQGKIIERDDIEMYKNYTPTKNMFGEISLPNRPIQIGKVSKGRQGERIYHPLGHAITLSAHGGGIGAKTGLYQINGKIRKLSPRECARLQGFPEDFILPNSISIAHRQFGNSVSIDVLQYILEKIIETINFTKMDKKQKLGSKTAKDGFKNEKHIAQKFNNWQTDEEAQNWLEIMEYDLQEIEYVEAVIIAGFKADVQVQITVKLTKAIDVQNLQVKLVSQLKGFNQIDKRWTDKYAEMWDMPDDISYLLKCYTGEIPPTIENPKDKRRMFINEFAETEQHKLVAWFEAHKALIVSDILKGRGKFAAEWMLVAQKINKDSRWILKPMNFCMNFFSAGKVVITKRGNLKISRINVQRKGGDNGRKTANMLQFKLNPAALFDA